MAPKEKRRPLGGRSGGFRIRELNEETLLHEDMSNVIDAIDKLPAGLYGTVHRP